jgi:hypothetical protein
MLPIFSLTTLSLRSSDQNPAISYIKSSSTTLIYNNIPIHRAIVAIGLFSFVVLNLLMQFVRLMRQALE